MSGTTWTPERMARLTEEEIKRLDKREREDLILAYLDTLPTREALSWLTGALLWQAREHGWDDDRWDVALARMVGRTEAEETSA